MIVERFHLMEGNFNRLSGLSNYHLRTKNHIFDFFDRIENNKFA